MNKPERISPTECGRNWIKGNIHNKLYDEFNAWHEQEMAKLKQMVIEDVPHIYGERLLEALK